MIRILGPGVQNFLAMLFWPRGAEVTRKNTPCEREKASMTPSVIRLGADRSLCLDTRSSYTLPATTATKSSRAPSATRWGATLWGAVSPRRTITPTRKVASVLTCARDQIRNFTAKVVECPSQILACVVCRISCFQCRISRFQCRISCFQCRISRFQGGMKGESGIMMGGLPLLAEQSPCRPLQAARH